PLFLSFILSFCLSFYLFLSYPLSRARTYTCVHASTHLHRCKQPCLPNDNNILLIHTLNNHSHTTHPSHPTNLTWARLTFHSTTVQKFFPTFHRVGPPPCIWNSRSEEHTSE